MHAALRNGEFQMYLQPKYDLATHRIAGAEALVRWQHPQKGLLQPGVFIELFEKNGFIVQIDLFMFEEVCKVLRRWSESGVAVPVSVNLSRAHLYQARLIDQFEMWMACCKPCSGCGSLVFCFRWTISERVIPR